MSDKEQLTLDNLFSKAIAAVNAGKAAPSFEAQLEKFVAFAQKVLDDYMSKNFPGRPGYSYEKPKLEIMRGGRYCRIVRRETANGQVIGRSAWAFVDSTNGDILKPAGWKAPAKHARGNIYDEPNWSKWIGPYGPAYLK